MNTNPYQPPAHDAAQTPAGGPFSPPGQGAPWPQAAAPTYELYAPNHIGLAAFLGTPLAAGWLLFLNNRRLGKASRATSLLLAGIGVTAVLLVLAFALPDKIGNVIPLLGVVAFYQLAKLEQPSFDAHVQAGGRQASVWKAVGAGVLSAVAVVAIVVPFAIGAELFADNHVDFGSGQEVTYEDGATEADARKLGDYLVKIGFFNGRAKDVILKKAAGGYAVAFAMNDGAWEDREIVQAFGEIRNMIARDVFAGQRVTVELCDNLLLTKKTLGP